MNICCVRYLKGDRMKAAGAVIRLFLLAGACLLRITAVAGTWTYQDSGTVQSLAAVHGRSLDNVLAVGASGTILRYDGTGWDAEASGTSAALYGVWQLPDGTNAYAVGLNTVLRRSGAGWSSVAISGATASDYYYGVWGSAPTDVFIGGYRYSTTYYQQPILLHYDGASWTRMAAPNYAGSSDRYPFKIYDVWGEGRDDVYAVGSQGMVIHYDGSTWSIVCGLNTTRTEILYPADEYRGVWGIGGKIYAGGHDTMSPYAGLIAYRDGYDWYPRKKTFPAYDISVIRGVAGTAWNNVFIAGHLYGGGYEGFLYHYDGIAWTQVDYGTPSGGPSWYDMWGMGGDYIVVGAAGSILRYESPLSILSTSPVNGATDVPTTRAVEVVFTKDISPATLTTASFRVAGASGTVAYDAGSRRATFTPSGAGLPAGTNITATITTAVRTPSGGALDGNYSWSFRTEEGPDVTPPTVVSTIPASGATGVSRSSYVYITFSEAMDQATLSAYNATTINRGTAYSSSQQLYIRGREYDTGTDTYRLETYPQFDYAQNYYVRVQSTVTDLAGNPMGANHGWTFRTGDPPDTQPPTVVATWPVDGAVDVPVTNVVTIDFSEAVQAATVTAPGSITATFMSGTVSYDDARHRATFAPSSNMLHNTEHTVRVSTAVKDLAGNAMGAQYAFAFRTEPAPDHDPPTVVGTVPADGATSVSASGVVQVAFSEPLDPATVTGTTNIYVEGVGGSLSWNSAANCACFEAATGFPHAVECVAHVTTNVADVAGNHLAEAYVFRFTIGGAPDTTPPTVVETVPADGATHVARDARITARFDEPIDPTTITTAGFSLSPATPASVSYSEALRIATLTPNDLLSCGTAYTVTLTHEVTDAAGNPLAETTWRFTTLPDPDGTPPVTTASPTGGWFRAATTVRLTCTDDGGACDKTYYTTNGADPTTASAVYGEPIPLTTNMTLKFFSTDMTGNRETVRTEVYRLDTVPPVVTAAPPGGDYGSNITVTLTCSDPDGSGAGPIWYAIGNEYGTYEVYTNGIVVGAPGLDLWYHGYDAVGNRSETRHAEYSVYVIEGWELMESGSSVDLADVWGWASNEVYAVGAGGTILRGNGSTWASESSGVSVELRAIHGCMGGACYAVGAAGTILRRDPGGWVQEDTAELGFTNTYHAVFCTPEGHVFAGGDYGVLVEYDGAAWARTSLEEGGAVMGIWGNATNSLFVVRQTVNIGAIDHWDGETWTRMNNPNTGQCWYKGIWGASSSDVMVCGRVPGSAAVLRYRGSSWANMPSFGDFTLLDIWGASGGDVYAVGGTALNGAIAHYDGAAWTNETTVFGHVLNGVWGPDARTVFAVGEGGWILRRAKDGATGDTTPPVTTASPAGGSYPSPVQVTLTATDAEGGSGVSAIYYGLGAADGPVETLYTAPVTVSSNATLRYFAVDVAGNSENIRRQDYTIGGAATNAVIVNAAYIAGPEPLVVQFRFSPTTFTNYVVAFGDGTTNTYNHPRPTHAYQHAGLYTVSVSADGPGGHAEASAPDLVRVGSLDTTPADGAWGVPVNTPVSIRFHVPVLPVSADVIAVTCGPDATPVPGTVTMTGQTSCRFTPDDGFPPESAIHVRLSGADDGIRQTNALAYLSDDASFRFNTAPRACVKVVQALENMEGYGVSMKPTVARVFVGPFGRDEGTVEADVSLYVDGLLVETKAVTLKDEYSPRELKYGRNTVNFDIPLSHAYHNEGSHVVSTTISLQGAVGNVVAQTNGFVRMPRRGFCVEFVPVGGISDRSFRDTANACAAFMKASWPLTDASFRPILSTSRLEYLTGLEPVMTAFIACSRRAEKSDDIDRVVGIGESGWIGEAGASVSGGGWLRAFQRLFTGSSSVLMEEGVGYYWAAAHELNHSYGRHCDADEVYLLEPEHGPLADDGWDTEKNECMVNLDRDDHNEVRDAFGAHVLTFMSDDAAGYEYWTSRDDYRFLYEAFVFPGNAADRRRVPTAIRPDGAGDQLVLLDGYVRADDSVTLNPIQYGAGLSPEPPEPPEPDYYVDFYAGVSLLRSYGFAAPVINASLDPKAAFSFTVMMPAATDRVVVRRDATPLATLARTASAPVVTVMAPNGGETLSGVVAVTWAATDTDSDSMTYDVYFSANGGESWNAVAMGLSVKSYAWDTALTPGTTNGFLKVVASDGFLTGEDLSDGAFTVPPKPPEATILLPADGSILTDESRGTFYGLAYDPQHGGAVPTNVTWTSSLDGPIGMGGAPSPPRLTYGRHVITLTPAGAGGATGTADTVTIRVLPELTAVKADPAQSGVGVRWYARTGTVYGVVSTTNPVHGVWVACSNLVDTDGHRLSEVSGNDETLEVRVEPAEGAGGGRYYRLRVSP